MIAHTKEQGKPLTVKGWESENCVLPRQGAGVREYDCDVETVLFDPKTWQTCVLNATAYEIWKRCDGRSTMGQVARQQSGNYEVEFDTALDYVGQVAAMFASLELFDKEAADDNLDR